MGLIAIFSIAANTIGTMQKAGSQPGFLDFHTAPDNQSNYHYAVGRPEGPPNMNLLAFLLRHAEQGGHQRIARYRATVDADGVMGVIG